MNIDKFILQVALEEGLSELLVGNTYKAFFRFIRDSIEKLPLKEDLSEEDFSKLRTNFNIPSIGKMYCTYDKYTKMKRQYNFIKEKYKNVRDKVN